MIHTKFDIVIRASIPVLLLAFMSTCAPSSMTLDDKLQLRKDRIADVVNSETPVLTLDALQDEKLNKAQELALTSGGIKQLYIDETTGHKLLNEVFEISLARPSDINDNITCGAGDCYRVDIYNYALNGTAVLIVDVGKAKVHSINFFKGMQPSIPEYLAELAVEIARENVDVKSGLGCKPGPEWSVMEATKTALNKTKCQRSQHLCVAPTFVKGDKALWAIVDLTDLKVVGVKWTAVGKTEGAITQRSLENEIMMSCYCNVDNHVEQGDWVFDYTLTRSDGLEVKNIRWNDRLIFESVKLVDWHVSYSETEGFGYSDAIGCPEFSQAAVIAINPPEILPLIENQDTVGFVLDQKYFSEGWPLPCSYNYEQRFEFYNDGGFRPVLGSLGRGCGNDGTYRPVTRIAVSGEEVVFNRKVDGVMKTEKREMWLKETGSYEYIEEDALGIIDVGGKYNLKMRANRGQFQDGSRGDEAYVYLTKTKRGGAEGDTDLPTIGPCCNSDYRQGPEKFIEDIPETLGEDGLVIWYVPEIKNDNRKGMEYCWAESVIEDGVKTARVYPCMSGPKFEIRI